MMSMSRRRGDLNSKLHMDRQPTVARITDPSLPAGKRREIDNVMKKARANNTNDYWDKKLIEVEEKDPNRWRHTGYKKMYIQGESSSGGESDREVGGATPLSAGGGGGGGNGGPYRPYNSTSNGPNHGGAPIRYRSRSPLPSNSRIPRKSPPLSPPGRRRPSPMDEMARRLSPRRARSPIEMGRRLGRPRSPPEIRRKSRSPVPRRSPPPGNVSMPPNKRGQILPRSRRPPSPPPRNCRSRTNSSMSSCSDDSCSVCSPKHGHRSRSNSMTRSRAAAGGPRSPPHSKTASRSMQYRGGAPPNAHGGSRHAARAAAAQGRQVSPSPPPREKEKVRRFSTERNHERNTFEGHGKANRVGRHSPPEDPRLKTRPPEPPQPTASASNAVPAKKKKKVKAVRTRIKIEGEKRKKSHSSSDSDDSGASDSDGSLPTFTATTRLTLSERFGKMAQWSLDRSNMENMRITKDSTGGALKVMIEEGLESPPHPRRYSYSPAPVGHFPEELATTAPSGMMSWDDVRVRYDYYKSRGYLRDLDLKDYIKWEEWWYKYQEWLKQERYYEYWERQQMQRRRRKKLPITQRLN